MAATQSRSRNGCLTCRRRRKKCDEVFDSGNSCGRCVAAKISCDGRPEPREPKSRRRSTVKVETGATSPRNPISTLSSTPASFLYHPGLMAAAAGPSSYSRLPVPEQPHPPFASTSQTPYSLPPPPPLDPQLHSLNSGEAKNEDYPFAANLDWGLGWVPDSSSFWQQLEVETRWASTTHEEGLTINGDAVENGLGEEVNALVGKIVSKKFDPEDLNAVSHVYSSLNTVLLESIRRPVREVVVRRLTQIALSHDLGRNAAIAATLLHCVRSQKGNDSVEDADLLAQSNQYFQKAVTLLGEGEVPLEVQLNAILDLYYHQLDQSGAAAAYGILLIGELFITQALSPRPLLDFALLSSESSQPIAVMAYTNVIQTVCFYRRRTLFGFSNLPGVFIPSPELQEGDDVELGREGREVNEACRAFLGLPVELLLCLAAVSNLSAELGDIEKDDGERRARGIEKAIKDWRPNPPDAEALADEAAFVTGIVTQELWRHAALIHLYQSVLHLGCLSSLLRNSLHSILSLATRQSPSFSSPTTIYAGSTRACAFFLASTLAIDPNDRELCRKGLKECGPSKVFRDNAKAAELIWERMDERGEIGDWRELLREEGIVVAFI